MFSCKVVLTYRRKRTSSFQPSSALGSEAHASSFDPPTDDALTRTYRHDEASDKYLSENQEGDTGVKTFSSFWVYFSKCYYLSLVVCIRLEYYLKDLC